MYGINIGGLGVRNLKGAPGIIEDLVANQPAVAMIGTLFVATDTLVLYRFNGVTWDTIGGGGGALTWQDTLNNGHNLNVDNSIDGGNNNLSFDNNFSFNANTSAGTSFILDGSGNATIDSAGNFVANVNQAINLTSQAGQVFADLDDSYISFGNNNNFFINVPFASQFQVNSGSNDYIQLGGGDALVLSSTSGQSFTDADSSYIQLGGNVTMNLFSANDLVIQNNNGNINIGIDGTIFMQNNGVSLGLDATGEFGFNNGAGASLNFSSTGLFSTISIGGTSFVDNDLSGISFGNNSTMNFQQPNGATVNGTALFSGTGIFTTFTIVNGFVTAAA